MDATWSRTEHLSSWICKERVLSPLVNKARDGMAADSARIVSCCKASNDGGEAKATAVSIAAYLTSRCNPRAFRFWRLMRWWRVLSVIT